MIDEINYDASFYNQSKICLRESTNQFFLLFECVRMYEIVESIYVLKF